MSRTLAGAFIGIGIFVVFLNRTEADESLWLGMISILTGAICAMRPSRLLEILTVCVCLLAGGEVTVRWQNAVAQRQFADAFVHFVADPELKYELKPNTQCSASRTNSFGMLDKPRALDKHAFRVACLGDSVGGDCQLPADNVCAALESIGSKTHSAVEVLNFSVPGYNTMQEARALETKAALFQPDAVVVLYVINDPYPDLAISHHVPGHLKFEHLLYGGMRRLLERLGIGDGVRAEVGRLYDDPRAWNVVVGGFDRLQAYSATHHIPVVVAIFPMFLERPSPSLPTIYQRVAAEAARHGFTAIDLSQKAYKDVPVSRLLKPSGDSIHPNAHAHQLAAAAIADVLWP